MLAVIVFFMMVRWSWPRFRFDQLMSLAWKVMLPLGLVNLVAVAVLTEYRGDAAGSDRQLWVAVAIELGRDDRRLGRRRPVGAAVASTIGRSAQIRHWDPEIELARLNRHWPTCYALRRE